jgi:HlyD family secretion protein
MRVANGALRVRIPQELLPKTASAAGAGKTGDGKAGAMTDDERTRTMAEILRAVGFERGSQASPDQIEKVKVLAKEKGLDPDLVAARMAMPGRRKGEGGDRGSRGGGPSFGGGGGSRGGSGDRGFNMTVVSRTLYKLTNTDQAEPKIEPVMARLGISDGFYTEVLEGLNEGDTVVTNVTLPGAQPAMSGPSGSSMQNPFQGGGSRMGGMRPH